MAADDGQSEEGQVSFIMLVNAPTSFVDYPRVRLWVEADNADDMTSSSFSRS